MPSIESNELGDILEHKLHCEIDRKKKDHNYYYVKEGSSVLSFTKISKGAKHTIGNDLVTQMARQLGLGVAGNLVKFVKCSINKEECLNIIRATFPPRKPNDKNSNKT